MSNNSNNSNNNNNWGNAVGLMIAFYIIRWMISIFLPKHWDNNKKEGVAVLIGMAIIIFIAIWGKENLTTY